eukprot:768443-Hanusia_phi.AAC.2
MQLDEFESRDSRVGPEEEQERRSPFLLCHRQVPAGQQHAPPFPSCPHRSAGNGLTGVDTHQVVVGGGGGGKSETGQAEDDDILR